MAYKALYRSYRPQIFQEIAGQEHIVTTLQNAIKENKIAHAYLFAGPRGTGKTTIAKLLAKALNCTSDNPPCGTCPNCISISEGQHPDVIEIDAASNNGVDEVRDLIDKVKYAPINGKYKVYIIDEVHMMTTGAFNALLKTLEEPPAHAIFILATTEPHKVIPTIISRCQRFDFKKVDDNDIISRLEYVLKQENGEYEDTALSLISKLAEGGMRDALSILEQCLAYNNSLSEKHINEIYGLLSMDNKINFIKKILSKDIKSVLELLEQMLSGSIDIKRLTFDIIDLLKDVIIYKNTQDPSILFVLSKKDIDEIVPYIGVDESFMIIDILIDASNHYSQSLNAKIYFELAMLKICNQVKEEQIQEVPTIAAVLPIKQEPIKLQSQPKVEETVLEEVDEPLLEKAETREDVAVEQPEEIKIEVMDNEPVVETKQEDITREQTVLKEVGKEITEKLEDNNEGMEEVETIIEKEMIEAFVDTSQENNLEEPNEAIIEDPGVMDSSVVLIDVDVAFEDILNILVQAERDILKEIKEKWDVLARYRYNLNTAKLASMLYDGTPVAAAKGGIIISFEHQPQVNEINTSTNYHHLKVFLKEVLGENFDFIAVKSSEWLAIRGKFIDLKNQEALPIAKTITLQHIKEYVQPVKNLNEAQQFAIDMFGEEVVEIEE